MRVIALSSLALLLSCNQNKPTQAVPEAAPKPSASAEVKTPADTVNNIVDEEDKKPPRATKEPTCPAEFFSKTVKSAPNAAGDTLSTNSDIFTGWDGSHVYKVPALVVYEMANTAVLAPNFDTAPPQITVADPSVLTAAFVATPADVVDAPKHVARRFVMYTTKKAGSTLVTFTFGTQTVSTRVHVTAYAAGLYEQGKKRYASPDFADASDRVVCSTCHAAKDTKAPDHDPYFQGLLSDESLILTAAFGKVCNDKGQVVERALWHQWHFTAEELIALPAYLRAIQPLGY